MTNLEKLVMLLDEKNLKISVIESFSNGLLARRISELDKNGKVLAGGLVANSLNSLEGILGIKPEFVEKNGVLSYALCQKEAINGLKAFGSDVSIAITGNNTTEEVEGLSAGEVYAAIAYKGYVWPIPLKLEMKPEKLNEYLFEALASALISII